MSLSYPVEPGWYTSVDWSATLHGYTGEPPAVGTITPGDNFYLFNTLSSSASSGRFMVMKSSQVCFVGYGFVGANFASQCAVISSPSDSVIGNGLYMNVSAGTGIIALSPNIEINKGDVFEVVLSGSTKTARKFIPGTTPSWTNFGNLTAPSGIDFMEFYGFEGGIILNYEDIQQVTALDQKVHLLALTSDNGTLTFSSPQLSVFTHETAHGRIDIIYPHQVSGSVGRLWYRQDQGMSYTNVKNGIHRAELTPEAGLIKMIHDTEFLWTVAVPNGATTLPEIIIHDVQNNGSTSNLLMDIEVRSDYPLATGSIVSFLHFPIGAGNLVAGSPDMSIDSYFDAILNKYVNRKIVSFQSAYSVSITELLQVKFKEGTNDNYALFAGVRLYNYWNLLKNGDFETGDLLNWTQVSDPLSTGEWQISATSPKRNDYSAKVIHPSAASYSNILYQPFEVVAGEEYEISLYGASSSNNSQLFCNVSLHPDYMKIADACTPPTRLPDTQNPAIMLPTYLTWRSYTFKALETCTVYFSIYAYGGQQDSVTIIDHLLIYKK